MVLGTPIVLNLIPSGARAVAHVNEVDQGAELQFAIYNGNTAYNVPEGVTATIRGTKGDGFGYTAAAAVTVGSNIITVTLDEQMTAVAGVNNIFELVLANSNGFRAGTSNFILDVERAALNENTVISDSDLAYAEQVLNDLQSVQAVNTQVQQNKAGLAAEIVNRQSADQTLQQNINAEAAARQAADNTLQSNINAEASTRATTDASLQSQINQLVAPSGEAPSAAEVENARIGSDGTVYPTLGDAIRTQNSLLKNALGAVESTFDERVQYLIASEWINGEYYGIGSTNIAYNASYRRYEPFVLQPGKYYYYHIHPLFTNIIGSTIAITNLTSFAGTIQIVNNDTGYFVINEPVTIYITSHFATGAMLSLYEQSVNNYVEGLYYIKPKYEGLLTTNIGVQNVHLTDIFNVSTSTYVVYSNGKIHQTSPSSGNAGWRVPVDVSKLKDNMVELVMDIESITGTGRLYLLGTSTSNQAIFAKVRDITTAGKQTDMFDLNYYVVYDNLDLAKTIEIAVYNQTNNFDCYYTAIDTYTITTELDTDKNLDDNLNDMVRSIEKNSNAINSIQSTSKMVSPNGTIFALQVSDSGELSTVRVLPTKTLFVGNSLLVGNGTFGMCATDNQHDYYHYVTSEITSKNADATFDKIKGTEFEAATDAATANAWMSGTLLSHLPNDLDLAIVQLGDNVNTNEKISAFATNCGNLIRYIKTQCPHARVGWVGEWYSTAQKQAIISNACTSTASVFVDISDLVTSENKASIGDVIHKTSSTTTIYTIDSYTDDAVNRVLTITFTVNGTQYTSELPYTSYTTGTGTITVTGEYTLVNNTGVSSHPSNKGMLAIANRICYALGITSSENEIVA